MLVKGDRKDWSWEDPGEEEEQEEEAGLEVGAVYPTWDTNWATMASSSTLGEPPVWTTAQVAGLQQTEIKISPEVSQVSGSSELNGVTRRCQSLRLGPRDISDRLKLNNNTDSQSNRDNTASDQETKLLMENQVGRRQSAVVVLLLACSEGSKQQSSLPHWEGRRVSLRNSQGRSRHRQHLQVWLPDLEGKIFLNNISSTGTRSQVNPSLAGWGTNSRISLPPPTTSWRWSYSDPRKLWWRKESDRKPSVTGSSIPVLASGIRNNFLYLPSTSSNTQNTDPAGMQMLIDRYFSAEMFAV